MGPVSTVITADSAFAAPARFLLVDRVIDFPQLFKSPVTS
jgi:hypothetical protein